MAAARPVCILPTISVKAHSSKTLCSYSVARLLLLLFSFGGNKNNINIHIGTYVMHKTDLIQKVNGISIRADKWNGTNWGMRRQSRRLIWHYSRNIVVSMHVLHFNSFVHVCMPCASSSAPCFICMLCCFFRFSLFLLTFFFFPLSSYTSKQLQAWNRPSNPAILRSATEYFKLKLFLLQLFRFRCKPMYSVII